MSKGTISIRGTGPLVKQLKKNANLNNVKRIVAMNGSEMQGKANAAAPHDTGNLKRNIKLSTEDGGFTAKVVSAAEYAAYQEYGTRYQSGTPHIRPAFNAQRLQFINDLKRITK